MRIVVSGLHAPHRRRRLYEVRGVANRTRPARRPSRRAVEPACGDVGDRLAAHCEAIPPSEPRVARMTAGAVMVHTRAHADDRAALARAGPGRPAGASSAAASSTPRLVVASADGARVTDVDGREFIDFAGGIGCQNTGHRFAPVVDAIHRQADLYLHQCFMVGVYEPYVETCRLLAELSPCAGAEPEVDPRQLGRGGERERRQDRPRRDRPARCVVFDNAFHGRTLLTMTMTSKVHPVQGRLRAVRARGVPRAGALPVPRRLERRRDRGAEEAVQVRGRPADRRLRAARAGAGRGRVRARCRPTSPRGSPSSAASTGSSTSTTRCSPASVARGRCGRSSTTTASSPTCSSRASRSAAACRSPPSRDAAELMDAVPARRARRDVRRQPALVRRRRRGARGRARAGVPRARGARSARRLRARLEELAARHAGIGEVRGLGPMIAFELPSARPTGRRRSSTRHSSAACCCSPAASTGT